MPFEASELIFSFDMTFPVSQRRPLRYAAAILSAVIGTMATIGAFLLVCSWEYRVAEIDFQSKAKSHLEAINGDLGDANTLLYTIAAFIESNRHPVGSDEFGHFSAALHRRVPGLRDTAWAPLVTLAARSTFERAIRAQGIPGYEIKQFGLHHRLIRSAPRSRYFPVLYIEADGAKRTMIGFDLISERLRAATALRAMQSGRPAATPPIDVVTVEHPGAGILSYMPVYRSHIAKGEARGLHSVRGLVLGVFDVSEMVKNILAKNTATHDLNLYLFNPASRSDRRVIYQTPSSDPLRPAVSEQALLAGTNWQSTVRVIDQSLGAIVTPAQPLRFVRSSLFGIVTLSAGFMITALIVGYLILSVRRTLQLEALTASLQATTVTLHEKAEQISQMSRTDSLTGIANSRLFYESIDEAIRRFRSGTPFTLLFLDLDRFKIVNDKLGHGVGDRLLCAVAERISACIRDVDIAARIGGDEFAIILADTDDIATISIVAQRLVDRISEAYTIDDQPIVIGVSIGAATIAQGLTAEALVAEADLAMYEAKEAGRGTFRFQSKVGVRAGQ